MAGHEPDTQQALLQDLRQELPALRHALWPALRHELPPVGRHEPLPALRQVLWQALPPSRRHMLVQALPLPSRQEILEELLQELLQELHELPPALRQERQHELPPAQRTRRLFASLVRLKRQRGRRGQPAGQASADAMSFYFDLDNFGPTDMVDILALLAELSTDIGGDGLVLDEVTFLDFPRALVPGRARMDDASLPDNKPFARVGVTGKTAARWPALRPQLLHAVTEVLDAVMDDTRGPTVRDDARHLATALRDYAQANPARPGFEHERIAAEVRRLYSQRERDRAEAREKPAEVDTRACNNNVQRFRVALGAAQALVIGDTDAEAVICTTHVTALLDMLAQLPS